MNTLNAIERRNYLATANDIKALTQASVTGEATMTRARTSFLRCLVATTQHELGVEPRRRAVSRDKITPQEREQQLKALQTVYKGFHEAIVEGIGKCSGEERASRTAFARSAKSTLKAWLTNGKDILTLAPAKVTKNGLREDHKPIKQEPAEPSAQRLAARLAAEVVRLAEEDKTAARRILQGAMEQLGSTLLSMGGVKMADTAQQAAREVRPVEIRGTMLFPLRKLTPANGAKLTADGAVANSRAA